MRYKFLIAAAGVLAVPAAKIVAERAIALPAHCIERKILLSTVDDSADLFSATNPNSCGFRLALWSKVENGAKGISELIHPIIMAYPKHGTVVVEDGSVLFVELEQEFAGQDAIILNIGSAESPYTAVILFSSELGQGPDDAKL